MSARPELDISNSWEIADISDPLAFIQFLLAEAPAGSKWLLPAVRDKDQAERLAAIAGARVKRRRLLGVIATGRELEIPINENTRAQLVAIAQDLDPFDVIEQHIIVDEKTLLVSYDNLSCCWVSNMIERGKLARASKRIGFRLEEEHAV